MAAPSVFAESRGWATCDLLDPSVIAGNKVYKCEDPDGYAFAVFSSSMFITWQKTVGGRLKSDPNFSNTIVWNTFPLPRVTSGAREAICAGGRAVLAARDLQPARSLADHYNPLAMAPELLRAHRQLDTALDKVLGLAGTVDEPTRLKALFNSYDRMVRAEAAPTLPIAKQRARARREPGGA